MSKNFLAVTFIILLGFCHCEEQKAVISVGLTIVDNASLRIKPDSTSKIIEYLKFGDPFWILNKKPFMEGRKEWFWYKAMSVDSQTIGWIISKQSREGSMKVVDLEKNEFAGLYYLIAGRLAWGHNEYEIAEKLLHYALETYGNRKMLLIEPITGGIEHVHANMAILKRLAIFYGHEKEFNKSIQYYAKRLAQKEATRGDTIATKYGMMRVYFESVKETKATDEATHFYHHIIRDFPNETMPVYEGIRRLDIEAAENLVEAFAVTIKDTNKLQQECQKIIDVTINPAVFLIATRGVVKSQIHKGEFESAKVTLLKAIKKYPKELRYYFKEDHENYTLTLLTSALQALINKYNNPNKAIELVESIEDICGEVYDISVDDESELLVIEYVDEYRAIRVRYKLSLRDGFLFRKEYGDIRD